MNSTLLAQIHLVAVQLFVLIYLIKLVLLFANREALLKFIRVTRLLEMVVSVLFLGTGIWLFVILGAIKMLQIIKLVLVFASIPLAVVGYRKMNKALALISFLLIIGAYGLAEAGRNKPYIPNNVIVEGNADARTKLGATTYIANCAMCHGQDGKKMYRDAMDLSLSAANNIRIDSLVRHGSKGKMPAFEGCLTDEQISAAEDYVITLRQPTTVQ